MDRVAEMPMDSLKRKDNKPSLNDVVCHHKMLKIADLSDPTITHMLQIEEIKKYIEIDPENS